MYIILIHTRNGHDHRVHLGPAGLAGSTVAGLVVIGLLIGALGGFGARGGVLADDAAQAWETTLDAQAREVERIREESQDALQTLTRRFAELQARLLRMEAVGSRVLSTVELDAAEFDFSRAPAMGGPQTAQAALAPPMGGQAAGREPGEAPGEELGAALGPGGVEPPAFMDLVEELSDAIVARQQQLEVLQSVIEQREYREDLSPSGRPIEQGWMSSGFGRRVDPINGELAWHGGLDFAGPDGSAVTAVASGVVVAAEERWGYGRLVEINHGNGYVTRYGHNDSLLVESGDVVRKGDTIARMGSTGRSTGPHVHFEVLKDGEPVDPTRYVHR